MSILAASPTRYGDVPRYRAVSEGNIFDVTADRRSPCDPLALACVHGYIDTQTEIHFHL